MAEIGLQGAGVVALVGQGITASVSKHVRVRLEGQLGLPAHPFDHAGEASGAEGRSPLRGEQHAGRPITPSVSPITDKLLRCCDCLQSANRVIRCDAKNKGTFLHLRPATMRLTCPWRSRPQHHERTFGSHAGVEVFPATPCVDCRQDATLCALATRLNGFREWRTEGIECLR